MTEHDAMARLAAANPVPEPGGVPASQALFCLRTVLAQPAPAPRRPRRRWLVPAAAALVLTVVAGVVTGGVLRAGRPAPAPAVSALAAPAVILAAAADVAGRETGEGRFVHTSGTAARVVHVDGAGGYDLIRVDSVQGLQPAGGRPGEGWLTVGEQGSSVRPLTAADARAYRRDGSPAPDRLPPGAGLTPDLAGDPRFEGAVGDLPEDPAAAGQAMLASIAGHGGAAADPQGWLFRECSRLLDTFTSVLGGADRAKVFRTLAALNRVRTLDAATDPLGRPAVGIAYTGSTPRHGVVDWQVYLRPGTDQISFTQAVVRQPGPANRTLTPGVVQYSTAVTAVVHSDTP